MKIKNWMALLLACAQAASLVLVVGGIVGAIKCDAIFLLIAALGVLLLVGLRFAAEEERRLRLMQEPWTQMCMNEHLHHGHQGAQGTVTGPAMHDLPPINFAVAVANDDFRVRYEHLARDVKRMRMEGLRDVPVPPPERDRVAYKFLSAECSDAS